MLARTERIAGFNVAAVKQEGDSGKRQGRHKGCLVFSY